MQFAPNQPFDSPQAAVVVDAGLPVGVHRFQLVVVGRSGRRSSPVEVIVSVVRRLPIPGPSPFPPPGPGPLPGPGPIDIPRSERTVPP